MAHSKYKPGHGSQKRSGGYEYWGRRPGPRDPARGNKRITHQIERQQAKEEIEELLDDFSVEDEEHILDIDMPP
jgi:hypothetical protein